MTTQNWGIVVGGFGTAVCFGLLNALARANTRVGLGPTVSIAGIGVILVGGLLWVSLQDKTLDFRSGTLSFAMGVLWAAGFTCITLSFAHYGASLSQVSPIFNSGAIMLSVLLGMIIFREWEELIISKLLLGVGLIIIGMLLVMASKIPK